MNRPMTVLQVLPALNIGGVERTTFEVAKGLVAAGHRAFVASKGGAMVAALESSGARHVTGPFHSKNPALILANAARLVRLVRREGVQIIHARSRAPAWSAWIAARVTGARFVTTFHASYSFSGPIKQFYNAVMARGDRVVAISGYVADHVRRHYDVPESVLRLISPGVDLESFDPAKISMERRAALAAKWNLHPGWPVILFPGRLSPVKGQAKALEALACMSGAGVQLVLLGPDQGRGSYRLELERMVQNLGLADRVRMPGPCADMPTAYSLADVVVCPSRAPEGLGRVSIEAQAMGVPVVAAKTGGLPETVIPGTTGWLVSPDDEDAIARAIEEALCMSPPRRESLAEAARAHVMRDFDEQRMVRDTLSLYAEVLS
ncbi:MAG: glycosyltransferase family 4 protein [Alphaproteobacteria bacterium]|nr:MAG: glycosyltransferase family 4 protein [Alphaproteobacteria bacterium]